MFNFLKKNNPRQSGYTPYQPDYNLNNYNNYDLNVLETKINELNRIINDLNKRINVLENYLGINNFNHRDF